MTTRTRVAIYYRTSIQTRDGWDARIGDRLAEAGSYCAEHDLDLIEVFVGKGLGRGAICPELRHLLDEALSDRRPYDAILVHSLSRISRDRAAISRVKADLQEAGVKLITMT